MLSNEIRKLIGTFGRASRKWGQELASTTFTEEKASAAQQEALDAQIALRDAIEDLEIGGNNGTQKA